ncbi:MAG TPA: helix-turn-helix transcriptional regulator [Streptosporangiaceae bacterium]|nr:helix-turn-helix transcriptional regulator [Streptosporangiaceae bacterium]
MTPREELADVLQRARAEAGYGSQGALAKRLNVSRPVISKAESASQPPPSDAILAAWAGATGAPLDRLNELAERARSGVPDWFVPWLGPESGATLLRYWSPFIVPGIAQIKAYMHALFEDEGHLLGQAEEMASARLQRQQVIERIPVTIIIGYHALYRVVGSPAVMSAQMGHLATLAERSMVAVHVLPENVTTGSYGELGIATGGDGTTVSMPTLQDITSTEPKMVSKALVAWERLLGAAMPRQDSLTLIRSAERSWKERA